MIFNLIFIFKQKKKELLINKHRFVRHKVIAKSCKILYLIKYTLSNAIKLGVYI